MSKLLALILTLIGISLAGCGGGGTSSSSSTGSSTATDSSTNRGTGTGTNTGTNTGTVQPSGAVLRLSTSGALAAGEALAGIGVTVELPVGTSIATDSTGQVQASAVTVSGSAVPGSVLTPVYTPATPTARGSLKFTIVSTAPGGFGVGEFATVTCNIASGSFPQSTDFVLSDFTPANLLLQPVTALMAESAAVIQ